MPLTMQPVAPETHALEAETTVYPKRYPVPQRGLRLPGEPKPVRRRAGREQGYAIERLGHAVEYLIDSRMFLTQVPYTRSEEEAVKILMRLNRMVFESCPEVLPLGQRLMNRLGRVLRGERVRPNSAGLR